MKALLATTLAAVLLAAGAAYAVPALQLYMPGSTYNPDTQSWLSLDNPFTLQVLGACKNGSIQRIESPYLCIAVPQDWWEDGTTVSLSGPGYESGILIDSWDWGVPEALSPHGIYPTYYKGLVLPDMDVANGTDVIYDYNPGGDGQDTGVIYEYTISYTAAFGVHMDASGDALKKNGKYISVFAPYSHDADAPGDGNGDAPEPGSLLLLAAGMLGLRARPKRS